MRSGHDVICFGEVLWDVLPSGAVPGGAPMNVAYHLFKLEKNPALITRVGRDSRGEELENIFSTHGLFTGFFQHDEEFQTGVVYAKAGMNHEMSYDIVKPVAWDQIRWREEYAESLSLAKYFVFGSLAARSEISRATLLQLLDHAPVKVFDINLRPPHYTRDIVELLLGHADILKINESELNLISNWFGYQDSMDDNVLRIMKNFELEKVVVTLGADGARLYTRDQVFAHKGFHVTVADTVGSGDAFLAAFLSKLTDHAGLPEALEFSCALGAFIASKTGACPDYQLREVEELMSRPTTPGIYP